MWPAPCWSFLQKDPIVRVKTPPYPLLHRPCHKRCKFFLTKNWRNFRGVQKRHVNFLFDFVRGIGPSMRLPQSFGIAPKLKKHQKPEYFGRSFRFECQRTVTFRDKKKSSAPLFRFDVVERFRRFFSSTRAPIGWNKGISVYRINLYCCQALWLYWSGQRWTYFAELMIS